MRFLPSRETKGLKGTKLRVSKFSAFWQHENAISDDSWKQRFKVLGKESGNFFFLSPENAILPSRVSKFSAFWWTENAISADL